MNIKNVKYFLLICGTFLYATQLQAKTYTGLFKQYLQGKSSVDIPFKTVSLKKVRDWQAKVWKDWQEAERELNEEKLPPLSPLSEGHKSQWHIPDSLEPNAVMPYYWGTKGQAETAYPLYIYLHGSGPKEAEWRTGLKICNRFNDAPSLYFIPQIPNEGAYYRWWQKGKQYVWEKLLRQALASDKVDPNRIYLFGISEGGYGSQRLASFYADYLSGAGPMAGGEPLRNAPAENYANIAFSFITGAEDHGFFRNLLTTYTKEALDSLEKLHPGSYKHRIMLVPQAGHFVDYSQTTPWLKQFKREPYPHYFCWEDFEMDGQRRNGFYNIAVVQRPEPTGRTRYEVTIKDNRISLQIQNVTYKTLLQDSGIELKFHKSYTPASSGKMTVYLCDKLVDMNKEVTIEVNGKPVFKGKPKANIHHMLRSCMTFFDPCRIYPAAVDITF